MMTIHNPNLANVEMQIGFDAVRGDPDGNFHIADDAAAEALLQTEGWTAGKNPNKRAAAPVGFGGDPRKVIATLRAELESSNAKLHSAETEIAQLKTANNRLLADNEALRNATPAAPESPAEPPEDDEPAVAAPEPETAPDEPAEAADEDEDEDGETVETVEYVFPEGDPSMAWKREELVACAQYNDLAVPKGATKAELIQLLGADA